MDETSMSRTAGTLVAETKKNGSLAAERAPEKGVLEKSGLPNGHGRTPLDAIGGIRRANGFDYAPFTPESAATNGEGSGESEEPLRIYIAGAHSTGKTTLARWVARTYKLPMVTEVARSVLAELEIPLETLRVDLERTKQFQKEVFRRQAEMERLAGNRFVSDRTFDNLAYACHHTLGLNEISRDLGDYAARLRAPGSLVFFVRPHRDLLTNDGVRAGVDWEEIIRIDGMVKLLLELHDVDYITIDTLNMAERARAVRGVLSAVGVRI